MRTSYRVVATAVVLILIFTSLASLASGSGRSTANATVATASTGPFIFKIAVGPEDTYTSTDNPLKVGRTADFIQAHAVLDTLLTVDGDFNSAGWLAYSFQRTSVSSSGASTFRFYLVHNACFVHPSYVSNISQYCSQHPLTATDVVFTYNMLIHLHNTPSSTNPADPAPSLDTYVASLQGATLVDSYTVDIAFSKPFAPWPDIFSTVPILPEFQWTSVYKNGNYPFGQGPVDFDPNPLIGSGPFMECPTCPPGVLELDRNDAWWGKVAYNLEVRPNTVQYLSRAYPDFAKQDLRSGIVDMDLYGDCAKGGACFDTSWDTPQKKAWDYMDANLYGPCRDEEVSPGITYCKPLGPPPAPFPEKGSGFTTLAGPLSLSTTGPSKRTFNELQTSRNGLDAPVSTIGSGTTPTATSSGTTDPVTNSGLPIQFFNMNSAGFMYVYSLDVASAAARNSDPNVFGKGHGHPALLDPYVRKAFAMTIDRCALVNNALNGASCVSSDGSTGETIIPSVNPWHYTIPAANKINPDPAGARAFLCQDGWTYDGAAAKNGADSSGYGPANNLGSSCNTSTVTPLAKDWVCNNDPYGTLAGKYKGTPGADANGYCQDGKINTNLDSGEILSFRFVTYNSPDVYLAIYFIQQRSSSNAGIELLNACLSSCGLADATTMGSILKRLDYDVVLWDLAGAGPGADPSDPLWIETTMALHDHQTENGLSDPYFDANYNTSLIATGYSKADVCRRQGAASGVCQGASAFANYTDKNGNKHDGVPYAGTDGMQQYLYYNEPGVGDNEGTGAADIVPLEGTQTYAFHEMNWHGFDNWNIHQGLGPDGSYWLFFRISPNGARAPDLWTDAYGWLMTFEAIGGQKVTLSAMATDSDGPKALTYTWDLDESTDTNGDGVPGNDANVVCPGASGCSTDGSTYTYNAPSVTADTAYYINARVSDGQWTSKARALLIVLAAPTSGVPPDVKGVAFSPYGAWASYSVGTTSYSDPVTFSASAASKSGGALSYQWNFGDGTQSRSSSSPQVQHTYSVSGSFTVTVFATDTSNGLVSQMSTIIKVSTNEAPFVSDVPTLQVYEGSAETFTASASDVNNRDVLTYSWNFGDGTTGTGQTTSHTYAVTGVSRTLTYSLSVADGKGHTTTKTASIYVIPNPPNNVPIFDSLTYTSSTGSTVYQGETLTIIVTCHDPEGNAITAKFQLPDGTTPQQSNPATAPGASVTFTQNAILPSTGGNSVTLGKVTVTLTDSPPPPQTSLSTSTYIQFYVYPNSPPYLQAPGLVGQTVNFGASVTYTLRMFDANGDSIYWTIDYGDGQTQTGAVPSGLTVSFMHTYTSAGPLNVVLTLDDKHSGISKFYTTTLVRGTLASFPYPFVKNNQLGGGLVIGGSATKSCNGVTVGGAAATIDAVGGLPVAGALGSKSTSGYITGQLDSDGMVNCDATAVTAAGDLMGIGGKGSNMFTKAINSNLPVRQANTNDGAGRGLYDSETAKTTTLSIMAASKDLTIYVSNTGGFLANDQILIDTGASIEMNYIKSVDPTASSITLTTGLTFSHGVGTNVYRGNFVGCGPGRTFPCPSGGSIDYAFFAIYYDATYYRYVLASAGLSGYATRAMSHLIALNTAGIPIGGTLLTGTGVVVKFVDSDSNSVYETFQVVDGSGGASLMASPASMPAQGTTYTVSSMFVIGLSQSSTTDPTVHCNLGAANNIDAVGSIATASKMGRDAKSAGTGIIWSSLDTEVVSTSSCTSTTSDYSTLTLLNTKDNLMAMGGKGVDLVTARYNANLLVRFALSKDGTGKGIYDSNTKLNYVRQATTLPYQEFALDSYYTDTAYNNRLVEVIAGLSGYATRAAAVALGDKNSGVSRGSYHGILISLVDTNGDNVYERISIADWAP